MRTSDRFGIRKIGRIAEALPAVLSLAYLLGCGTSKNPVADFDVSISSSSLFVPIGNGSASLQVSIQGENGFHRPVSVSVTGLPAGVTVIPASPFILMAGDVQTVTFTASAGTQPVVQSVMIQGSSGIQSHGSAVSLSIAVPVYAYIANGTQNAPPGTNDVAGFAVDSNTGAITKLAGGATNLIQPPIDLVSANEQGGTFVFVLTATGDDENLASFKVDPGSGSLTPVQNISSSNDAQQWLAVHPSGKFLYTQRADNSFCLLAYLIDPVTGNLTEASCSSEGGGDSLVIAPSGNFGWSSDGILGRLYSYTVSQTDGSLSLRFNDGFLYGTTFVAIDPLGRALYAFFRESSGCGGLAGLWSIDPNSGYLTTAMDSNSMNPQCEPVSITFTPADTFAYVVAEPSDQSPVNGLFVGSVDPTTGNLINVPGSPVTPTPLLLQAEPSQGNYLIGVVGPTPYSVTSFAIDSTTGLPTRLSAISVPLTEQAPVKMILVAPIH